MWHEVPQPSSATMVEGHQGPALSYSLIRLKPAPHCLPRCPMALTACMQRRGFTHVPVHHRPVKNARGRSHDTLYRWLFLYLPVLALVLLLLYFLAEIFMKRMAMQNIQQQWQMLPETVEDLPLAPQQKSAASVPSPELMRPSPEVKPCSVAPQVDTPSMNRAFADPPTLPPLEFGAHHEGFSAVPTQHPPINLDFLGMDLQSSWGALP